MSISSGFLIAAIGAYRKLVSPYLPRCCRFYPSCSTYAVQSIKKYGALRGTIRAVQRIARCHPWHPGGVDPVR
ncbi:MAG: membrane protein insertion efficiency factor YidD [Candidatus Latescibacterota bacterium]|nr:MAG: membrane protein insertion efficiency factor YidD [Candidatus Latescibacterota bacterium]